MLSRNRIAQLLVAGQEDRLIDELLANGRQVPLSLRLLLSDPAGRRAAMYGLALQRLAELMHGADGLCSQLFSALRCVQSARGGFGTDAATVAAAAGLLTYGDYAGAPLAASALEAAGRALDWLSGRQDERGLIGGGTAVSLLAVRLLMARPEFLARVRFGELAEALMEESEGAGAEPLLAAARRVSSAA